VLSKKFGLFAVSRELSNVERTDDEDNRGLASLGSVSVNPAQCTQFDLYFSLLLSDTSPGRMGTAFGTMSLHALHSVRKHKHVTLPQAFMA